MPVPTLVTDLSTTLASNSPSGSDNVFPDLDNYLRAMSGFIASIRDNSGNGWVSPYVPLTGGTLSGNLTLNAGTANGVTYLNASKVVTTGSSLVFDGTNLGLGVTPSAWAGLGYGALQVGRASLVATSSASQTLYNANAYYDNVSWKYIASAPASRYQQNGGAHSWDIAASGTAGNAISFTQALTLTAAANLLLGGTNDPGGANALYIANTASVPGTPTSGGVLYVESGALKYKGSSGTVTTIANA